MIRFSRKYLQYLLVLVTLTDTAYSHDNGIDNSTDGRRHGRVSGRIVKLYSGPKPDPVLCLSEGFLADTVDCTVFYRCLKASNGKYTVYRFQCGPGTVYDPDTEICNHPRSTRRSECGGLKNFDKLVSSMPTYIENEIDETQYKEHEELPSPISTKAPKFNISIPNPIATSKFENQKSTYTTSAYPWVTTAKYIHGESNIVLPTTTPGIPTSLSTVKPWDYTPTRATYYVTSQPSIHSSLQCRSDGFMGDNKDCRKFYRCVNNQRGGYLKYEFSCSETTIWDEDTQSCNHPWAVQRRRCGKGNYDNNDINYVEQIKGNEVTLSDNIQKQTKISYGSKLTQVQNQIRKEPSVQNKTQINFGDRLDQNKNKKNQNTYEEGISQSSNQFNKGYEVTQTTQSQVNYLNYFTETQTQILSHTLSTTSTPKVTQYLEDSSTSKCTKEGFVGDSKDCKKFYRCISNEKGGYIFYEFSCSEGTVWDEELEACNHAWAVKKCAGNKLNQNIPVSPVKTEYTTFNEITTMSSSIDNNEIGYLNKNNQQEQPKSSTKTALLTTRTTEPSKLYETDCKSNGFFGNVNDCAKFYRCVEDGNGRFKKYEYRCGDGTLWDPEIESCNHARSTKSCTADKINDAQIDNPIVPSDADNTIITTVSLIETTQKNIYDDYDFSSGYDTLHKEPSLTSTTMSNQVSSQEPSQSRECKRPGFIGDNSNCNKFYRCVENGRGSYTRYEFTCGEGTVWDPDIEACNHAWAVEKCGGGPVKDNNISEVTSLPTVSESKNDSYNTNQDSGDDNTNNFTTLSSSTNSATTLVPNKANDCQSNGFMGDDNDCGIFYRCVENGNGTFTRYEFSCGDGTVWDPKIDACNHIWAVEKCGRSTYPESSENFTTTSTHNDISTQHTTFSSSSVTTSTISDISNDCMGNGFIADKQDCKKFYRCVEDGKGSYIRYEFACGENTLWDSNINACNHEWAVKSCGNNVSPNIESTSTSRPITVKDDEITASQSNQEISSSSEDVSWSSSTIKSTTVDSIECATDGFMGDIYDCKKFYRCVSDGNGNFKRYEFTCGEGTVWDSEINSCNHANSVKTPCTSMSTLSTKETEPNYGATSLTTEVNDYSTTFKNPSVTHQCDREGFFGDKKECKKFYRCTDNGQGGFLKYEFTCGEGTFWDQEILACNHAPSNLHCGSIVTDSQTDNSNIHSTTLQTSVGPSQSTEKTQTTASVDKCSSEGFYANKNDCKKFIRCVGDGKGGYIKYDFKCGEGTVWVQDIQACDHDSNPSLCGKETITTTTAITFSEQTTGTSSTTTDRSTSTQSTKPTLQDESVSGSSSTTETSPSTSSTMQDQCKETGYFGNSKDCKMFYRCVDNGKDGFTKYDFTCGDGTIWDQDINACNHPQDVSNPTCENQGSSSTTTTSTTKETTSSESSEPTKGTSSTESTTSENSNQNVSTNKPSNNNYTCTEAGFYADPYDCKKFYRCVDWGNDGKTFSIYHFDCGEGTIWDPELQTCNHEDSVYPPRNCNGQQSQTDNNTSTATTNKQEETTESSTTETSTTTTQSTTQKSTTSGSTTTTKSSSTTGQSSTQESSTTEQTTTTEESNTQPSSSTQQSTTSSKPNTTQQSTTEETTTKQSTTEQTTTQQGTTTSDPTTQQSTTSEQTTTTEQSTTTSNEETSTTLHTTTTESSTSTTGQTTKEEQTTTQETNTEQSSENQSSTTEQSTTQETTDGTSTTVSGQESTTEQQPADSNCPQTDDDQYLFVCPTGFRRHPKYCNLFYQCTEDDDSHEMKVAIFNCPNNTIYDETKTQCVEEENADKKCDGQIAQKRRVKRLDVNYKEPITVGKQKYSCPAVGHFPFEKNEECSPVLFKCEVSKSGKLRGLLYQCPKGYVYWSISRRCEPIRVMTECKHSLSNWNGRYEIPIERNNVARKTV